MPDVTDPADALRRIAALAEEALHKTDMPASFKPLLDEIRQLAAVPTGDTPGESDVPKTENQSL